MIDVLVSSLDVALLCLHNTGDESTNPSALASNSNITLQFVIRLKRDSDDIGWEHGEL